MSLLKPYYNHYPYEQLTDKITADIARSQDRLITDLQYENKLLRNELYVVQTWRKKVIPILEANNIDVEAVTRVMAATEQVFK